MKKILTYTVHINIFAFVIMIAVVEIMKHYM